MNLNENYNSQQIIGYCKFACAASESAHACNSCTTSNLLCHPEIEPSLRLQLEASEICSPIDKREIVLGLNKWTFSTIHTPCTFGMQRRSRERSWAPRELKNCYGIWRAPHGWGTQRTKRPSATNDEHPYKTSYRQVSVKYMSNIRCSMWTCMW